MFPSKRKFERKYTSEEAAQMIMESDEDEAGVENTQLVDSDDSIVSTSAEELSFESDADTTDFEIESLPPSVSPIPGCSKDPCDEPASTVMNSTIISTFSGDSAIPPDVFTCPTNTNVNVAKSIDIASFFGLGKKIKEKKRKETDNNTYIWTSEEPTISDFEFKENEGLTIQMPPDASPEDFLRLFITDDLITELCISTNLYANIVISKTGPLLRRSTWKTWTPVSNDEIRKFLGLVFHMGLINMPSYKHYWKKDKLYKTEAFSSVMSRKRFQLIMRFLHFGDRPDFPADRLGKVKLLLHHLNDTMAELYIPGKDLSLDESMMLYRGRLIFRQYIKNKRHKYGVKYYELCTSDGLILRTSIYSGQGEMESCNILGKSAEVVLDLMNGFFGKGHHLFTDSYYNSVPLTRYLTENQTYISGTLRKDRVDNPKSVTNSKLKKGQWIYACDNEVTVTKWKDKREVLVISNAHVPEMIQAPNRNGKMKIKPNIVRDYNDGMSGVDRSDQMMSYNSAMKKSLRWNKKVGTHLLEMMVHNSHYLFKKGTNTKMTITTFKEHSVRWLLGEMTTANNLQPVANFHYLHPIPSTGKKDKPTRKCICCHEAGRKRKESRYMCAYCDNQPALCIFPCFVEHHVNLGVTSYQNI